MTGTITREQYMQAYKDAPEIVRAVYDADSTVQIIVGLQAKYKLHADEAGLLGTGVGNMLLGLVNPQEFLDELLTAKVPENDAKAIISEINQKIFVPLREQMEKGPVVAAEPAKAAASIEPQPMTAPVPSSASRPVTTSGADEQSKTYFHTENKIVPPPPTIVPAKAGARPALRDVLSAVMKKTPEPMSGSKLLEDHEEPRIDINNKVQTVSPTSFPAPHTPSPPPPAPSPVPPANIPGSVLPRFTPLGMRPKFTPAPNLPPRVIVPPPAPAIPAPPVAPNPTPPPAPAAPTIPAVPKIDVPAVPIAPVVPMPPKPSAPPSAPITPPAPAKPYAGDPYREPIEP